MIALCVAKIGKNKYSITTTDMKEKVEAKYCMEQQTENMKAQMQYRANPFYLTQQQAMAQAQGLQGLQGLMAQFLGSRGAAGAAMEEKDANTD